MLRSNTVQAFSALVARARARFPGITSDDAMLAELVARDAAAPAAELSEEIVLTTACVAGDAGAIRELEHHYCPQLVLLISGIAGERAEDVMQDVLAKLLTASGRPPRLAEYRGRGRLVHWLRVVATREALSALRATHREVSMDDDTLWSMLVTSHDPELALIRVESVATVKRAFASALGRMELRDRNLLRQHLLDQLTIDDLAPLYGVHRVTIARWLDAARETVWSATQKSLRTELGLSPSQLESLLTSIRDYLDLSLERVL